MIWGIAINAQSGDVYAIGRNNNGAPLSAVIVTRYNGSLTQVLSRYAIQGNINEEPLGIAISPITGDVYVTGVTRSWSFPKIAGGAFSSTVRPASGVFERIFVARLDKTLSTHYQSTYLFNGLANAFHAGWIPVAVDSQSGDVVVAGEATADLGLINGAAQNAFAGGNSDGLIVRFSADLKQSKGATYFGGTGDENIAAIDWSPDGQSLYVGGTSDSAAISGFQGGQYGRSSPTIGRLSADLKTLHSALFYSASWSADAYTMAVHPATGEAYIAGATNGPGLQNTAGSFGPEFTYSVTPAGTYDAFIARFDAALSTLDSSTPSTYSFPTQTGVAVASTVTSAPIRIYGYTTDIPISVSGGAYSLDGQAFTTVPGTLHPGQMVRVRHTSASNAGQSAQTTITAGGVSGSFQSIVQSGTNSSPTPFNFTAVTSAPRQQWVVSPAIIVQGTNAPAVISVAGGQYSIDNGPFTITSGIIHTGQVVRVGHTTAATFATTVTTNLSIGGIVGQFASTTESRDTTPEPFFFETEYTPTTFDIPADSDVYSTPAVIIGINDTAAISITGGEYRIGGNDWTSSPGVVNNLEAVSVRLHSGAVGTVKNAVLTIGGVSANFRVAVTAAFSSNQMPSPFSIGTVNGAEPWQWTELPPISLTGFSAPIPISFGLPSDDIQYIDVEWFDPLANEFVRYGGLLAPSQPLRLRVGVYMPENTVGGATIIAGGTSTQLRFATRALNSQNTPTPFIFSNHTDAAPGSTIISETVTILGLGVVNQVNASGCEVSVNNGYYSANATIVNGDKLTLKIVAPSGSGQTNSCTISIGSYQTTTSVSTSGSATQSSSGNSGGGGGASEEYWIAILLALRVYLIRHRAEDAVARDSDSEFRYFG